MFTRPSKKKKPNKYILVYKTVWTDLEYSIVHHVHSISSLLFCRPIKPTSALYIVKSQKPQVVSARQPRCSTLWPSWQCNTEIPEVKITVQIPSQLVFALLLTWIWPLVHEYQNWDCQNFLALHDATKKAQQL